MIEIAGAANAAAEPLLTPPDADGGAEAPDFGARQVEPAIDQSRETARHSLDRAFAALDADPSANLETRRDERRHFKVSDPASAESSPENRQPVAAMEAPARFSPDAKAEWAGVPDSVKGEVGRAFRELETGLTQYQHAFEPLKPFFQMAQHANTTVQDALERYTALDGALISGEPEMRLHAIESILDYAGITPHDYAAFILSQKPEEAQSRHDHTIRELRQQVADLQNHLGGVTKSIQQRHEDEALKQVEAFAEANPRLREPDFQMNVLRLLQTQMADDLQSAYAMAERLTPVPVRAALNPKPGAAQTRNGNLSVTGAPGSGSNPARRRAPATARESVDSAFASLGLG